MQEMHFGKVTIGRVSDSSAVFKGDNRVTNWQALKKVNQGFGSASSPARVVNGRYATYDRDVMDHPQNGK